MFLSASCAQGTCPPYELEGALWSNCGYLFSHTVGYIGFCVSHLREGFGLLQWLHSLMVPISPVNFIPPSTLSKMSAKGFQRPFVILPPLWEGHSQASFPLREGIAISWVQTWFRHYGPVPPPWIVCDLNTVPRWKLRPHTNLVSCAFSSLWLISSSLALGESPFKHGSALVFVFYMLFHLWSKR